MKEAKNSQLLANPFVEILQANIAIWTISGLSLSAARRLCGRNGD
jgi:hypothetical protein